MRLSSKTELLSVIEAADVVYGGDFHAFAQAQRTHLRILRSLPTDRSLVLGLECFPRRSQRHLDDFLSGDIESATLRRRVKWDSTWGFPWAHYLPLLELARTRRFGLRALGAERGAVLVRDQERIAAAEIADVLRRRPGALLYVIFGDFHLNDKGLPLAVRAALGPRRKSDLNEVRIHLNPEAPYFRLAKRSLEHSVDVVRFSQGEFAVLSSPPWVPWQNYLLYLDHSESLGDSTEPDEFHLAAPEATDHVARFSKLLAHEWKIERRVNADALSVHPSSDAGLLRDLQRVLDRKRFQVATHLIDTGRSFLVYENQVAHLANPGVNPAAHLAGAFVHAQISGNQRTPWIFPQDMERAIWCEAVAFFLSKTINHKRRALTLADLRAEIMGYGLLKSTQDEEALRLALDHRMSEVVYIHQGRTRPSRFKPRHWSSYIESARILGAMMGERLFFAMRAGKLKRSAMVRRMKLSVEDGSFKEQYLAVVKELGSRFDSKLVSRRETL
jgi:hypothetical protein